MTPNVVQEAIATVSRIPEDQFIFIVCQHGVEATVKEKWLNDESPLRLAFSRPGLLTFKIPGNEAANDAQTNPETLKQRIAEDWPIRHMGTTICNIRGPNAQLLVQEALDAAGTSWDAIHVFQRDTNSPGVRGFEPGPTELSREVGQLLAGHPEIAAKDTPVNLPTVVGAKILNVILVEPDQWLIGAHVANSTHSCWPGGVIEIVRPSEMISRAYVKLSEALLWSKLPIQPGDEIVEIGSAPGGSCQRLLDLGLKVTGVDPAEMDPLLDNHARFQHWRSKSAGIQRKRFSKFKWLTADANVAPNYTLDVVEDIVNYRTSRFQGLVLTLKLSSYSLSDKIDEYVDRIKQWGFGNVNVRQLASNRRECCVVATRERKNRDEEKELREDQASPS